MNDMNDTHKCLKSPPPLFKIVTLFNLYIYTVYIRNFDITLNDFTI